MKKKVLFLTDDLGGGGAEKVLCDIVANLDKNKYDVSVMTYFDRGIYIHKIKKYASYSTFFKTLEPGGNLAEKLYNVFVLEFLRKYIMRLPLKYLYRMKIKEKYDIEIAFLEGISSKIISHSPNKNSRKYAWVHIDLLESNWTERFYKDLDEQKQAYMKFNKIFCVSETAKESFIRKFEIEDRVYTQYNPLDEKSIKSKALEVISDIPVSSKFKIVTVGRLEEQKGYDRLLKTHKKLIEEGFDFELWILGEGKKREEFEQFINDNNLSDSVKLLGFKKNPYKYIKQADLFVCSSRNEGFSLVVAEALILGIPVISTNCTGPNELLNFGEYGMLVENSTEGIYESLKRILKDKSLYNYYMQKAIDRSNYFKLSEKILEIEQILDA